VLTTTASNKSTAKLKATVSRSEWFRMVQNGFSSIPLDDGNYGPEFGHVLWLRAIKDIYIPPLNVHRGHEHTEANGMRYRGDTEYHNPSGHRRSGGFRQ
jgi:hypothetical protein